MYDVVNNVPAIAVAVVALATLIHVAWGEDDGVLNPPKLLWRSTMTEEAVKQDFAVKEPYKEMTIANDAERGAAMKMESCGCCGHYYTTQGFACTLETPCLISYHVKGPNAWQGFSNLAPTMASFVHNPKTDCLAANGEDEGGVFPTYAKIVYCAPWMCALGVLQLQPLGVILK